MRPTSHRHGGTPAIIAHRGAAATHPENTLSAFRAALACDVQGVEMDIQIAACGTPMVIHDATLDRTTGERGAVEAFTASQLATLSAHEPGRLGSRFAGEPIPTLATVCDWLAGQRPVTVFIEIKTETVPTHASGAALQRIEEDSRALGPRRVVISYSDDLIQSARSLYGMRIGWVLPAYEQGILDRAMAVAPEFVFCDIRRLPAGSEPLPSGGWEWAIYEITEPRAARRLHAQGVGWIETMAPARLIQGLALP